MSTPTPLYTFVLLGRVSLLLFEVLPSVVPSEAQLVLLLPVVLEPLDIHTLREVVEAPGQRQPRPQQCLVLRCLLAVRQRRGRGHRRRGRRGAHRLLLPPAAARGWSAGP